MKNWINHQFIANLCHYSGGLELDIILPLQYPCYVNYKCSMLVKDENITVETENPLTRTQIMFGYKNNICPYSIYLFNERLVCQFT